jgi:hypothetical protein
MTNYVDDFKPSSLIVQQTEIHYDIRIDTGAQQPRNDSDSYFRPLVEDPKELWYNDGVHVWDERKCEYFGLKVILFVAVSDSPVARNLSGQSKKVGYGCPHYFRETDSQYLRESQKIVYMRH